MCPKPATFNAPVIMRDTPGFCASRVWCIHCRCPTQASPCFTWFAAVSRAPCTSQVMLELSQAPQFMSKAAQTPCNCMIGTSCSHTSIYQVYCLCISYAMASCVLLHRMPKVRICASTESLSQAMWLTQRMMTQIGTPRRRAAA